MMLSRKQPDYADHVAEAKRHLDHIARHKEDLFSDEAQVSALTAQVHATLAVAAAITRYTDLAKPQIAELTDDRCLNCNARLVSLYGELLHHDNGSLTRFCPAQAEAAADA